MTELHYPGEELELFSQAHRWKNYWMERFCPYLGEHVLEVGAGLGANASLLIEQCSFIKHYTAVEPDPLLYEQCLNLKSVWPARFDVYQQTLLALATSIQQCLVHRCAGAH
jgi:16S rRNA A1518/A1519 N6-dimethyltransferase RsmA/KsgA/DIM1 with predicted DNA glycosylase/AP lyase activity